MTKAIGILLFDDVEELDFVGPYEVFTMMSETQKRLGEAVSHDVFLLAETDMPVRCAKGMQVVPHKTIGAAPALDVLLIPGGMGTRREVKNKALLAWIASAARNCRWVTSVCTGSYLLAAAGPARGKRVTTHWAFVEQLRARGDAGEVMENIRYVRDGNVVTSAGVSAGIDMALWVAGQLHSPAFARDVQRAMQYDPAPPYAAEA
jgi:transcriptional regulator GlxA family with amidase domain